MNKELLHKAEQLYCWLLRLYPKKFTREFSAEMQFVFAESLRHAYARDGNKGLLVVLGWTLIDLCASLFKEHWQDGKDGQAMQQKHTVFAGLTGDGGAAVLQQPSARKMEYEFRTDNELVGTLHWPRAWRSTCVAESAEGSWTFTRHGLFTVYMTARLAGSEQDILVYKPNWTGMNGPIRHRDGRQFHLRGTNMWGNSFALVQKRAQEEEVELLTVKFNFHLLRGSADVAIQPQLAETEDAALLALFGCYLGLMAYEESANMSCTYGGVAAITA